MDDARPPPSLFLVLSYAIKTNKTKAPYSISVLQLETPPLNNNHEYAATEPINKLQVNLHDQDDYIVARFREPPECPLVNWLFTPPTVSTEEEDLYLVPDSGFRYHSTFSSVNPPSRGYKFNFRTGECRPIKPPTAPKPYGHVVNRRGGHLYFMAHPDWYYETPDPVFECYDPHTNKWKALEPFPDHAVHLKRGTIEASAVLDDTIVYNMGGRRIWAYNVPKDKWYIVHVEDDRCYGIVGEAVVLDNTNIYALTNPYCSRGSVLALSIQREENDGDLAFRCSLRSVILVPGMDQIKYKKVNAFNNTRHLVHLGEDKFCLVQSCGFLNNYELNRYQPIQVTSLKLTEENSMTVTNICVYEVEIQPEYQFEVRLCFSLPECKTTAFKQGQRFLFNLDPCRRGHAAYVSKQEDKTYFNPEPENGKPIQASTGDGAGFERSNTAEEGHSIYVKKLPPNATVRQLDENLKKFGPIKKDGIRVLIDNTLANCHLAVRVEFENATSKRDAIEASSIVIQGCRAEIVEKREDWASLYIPKHEVGKRKPEVGKPVRASTHGDGAASERSNTVEEVGKPVQASTQGDGAASERSNTVEEGHSICVRNLPSDATVRQLEKELKKFGPIKRDGILVILDNAQGSCPAVYVEFESATSKRDAIEASSIMIQGRRADIDCCRGDAAYASKQKDITHFNLEPQFGKPVQASTYVDGAVSERSYTAEEGHSIYIRLSEKDVAFGKIEMGWKNFGKIQTGWRRFAIRFIVDDYMFSAIITEGFRAVQEQKRSSGPTVDDKKTRMQQKKKLRRKMKEMLVRNMNDVLDLLLFMMMPILEISAL